MTNCELCDGEVFLRPLNPPFFAHQCERCGFARTVLDEPSSIEGLYPLADRLRTYATRRREFERRFKDTIRFLRPTSPTASFLEIGGNVGAFSRYLISEGFDVNGVEIQPDLARHQRSMGIPCVARLQDLPLGKRYDYIVMMDVLEHIPGCPDYLRGLKGYLKPAGAIFLQFPNSVSSDARILGENWGWWEAPDHLFHFTPSAVDQLAKMAGFRVLEIRTVDLFLDSLLAKRSLSRIKVRALRILNGFQPLNTFRVCASDSGSLIQSILTGAEPMHSTLVLSQSD